VFYIKNKVGRGKIQAGQEAGALLPTGYRVIHIDRKRITALREELAS
jgi:hypothetical protein